MRQSVVSFLIRFALAQMLQLAFLRREYRQEERLAEVCVAVSSAVGFRFRWVHCN